MSPVMNQPSGANAAAVARGIGVADEQSGPRLQISPGSPELDVVAVVVDEAHLHAGQRLAVGVEPLVARRRRASSR